VLARWTDVLVLVKPDTVAGWHRAGFRLYWRWRSRPLGRRPKITEEIRVLIRRLAQENQDWGAPKIHGELQKLGFFVSERVVQQLLEAFPEAGPYRYAIFMPSSIEIRRFNEEVVTFLEATGLKATRTSVQAP
jgi:hypothetical protein